MCSWQIQFGRARLGSHAETNNSTRHAAVTSTLVVEEPKRPMGSFICVLAPLKFDDTVRPWGSPGPGETARGGMAVVIIGRHRFSSRSRAFQGWG